MQLVFNANQEFSSAPKYSALRDAARGPVKAPLLRWPYLWANGTTPRKTDGLTWAQKDYLEDLAHPSESGRQKVADQLLTFFKTDTSAQTWFMKR